MWIRLGKTLINLNNVEWVQKADNKPRSPGMEGLVFRFGRQAFQERDEILFKVRNAEKALRRIEEIIVGGKQPQARAMVVE